MKPPAGATIYEQELATFWFGEDGILYAKAKNAQRTLEIQKRTYEFIRQISGGKKVCLLSDLSSGGSAHDDETREYMAREMPHLFKAMALISTSAFARMATNTFMTLKGLPVPLRSFDNEEEAREWLKEYLD